MHTVREKRPIGKPASGEREQLIEAASRQPKPRMLAARYAGWCDWCRDPIRRGAIIAYSSMPGARYTVHSGCHLEMHLAATGSAPL